MNTNEQIPLLFTEHGESLQEKLAQIIGRLTRGGEPVWAAQE